MDQHEEPGLHPIGSLARGIVNSQSGLDSTPMLSQPNSATTGAQCPAPEAASSATAAGRELSGTVVAKSLGDLRAMALHSNNPAATTHRLLACLRPLASLCATCNVTDDPYHAGEISGYAVISNQPIPNDARQAALDLIEAASTPLPPETLLRELTRLRALTVTRAAADEDVAMLLAAYADALADQPGDAVRAALRQWPKRNKFWPALAELVAAIEDASGLRSRMAMAIRTHRPASPEPHREPPTAEEISAIDAMLRAAGIPKSDDRQLRPPCDPPPADLAQRIRGVRQATAGFRLPPPDDPGVLAMMDVMGLQATPLAPEPAPIAEEKAP